MTNFCFFSIFVNIFGVLPLQNAWFSGCILTKLTNILFFVKSVNVFGKYVDKIDTFLKICQICQPRCRTPPKNKGSVPYFVDQFSQDPIFCHTSPLRAPALCSAFTFDPVTRRVRTLYHDDSAKNTIGSHDSMIPSLRQRRKIVESLYHDDSAKNTIGSHDSMIPSCLLYTSPSPRD